MSGETSLRNKGLSGIKWSFIDNIAGSGITFLVGVILARILTPAEFGIIGIITVFIAISNVFIDSGFSTALIRKVEVTQEDYNTVFYSNLIVSTVLIVFFLLTSKSIAHFFAEPSLEVILPVMSLLLLINALTIVQRTDLVRKIDFKTQAVVSLIASVGSGVLGISLALLKFGIWSLVWQQLSRQLLISLFLWVFNRWKPTINFSKDSFKELFGFGSKILFANLINTIYKNIFNIIIGKVYSPADLGQYNRADQFNIIFTNNLTSIIQRVSLPTLSSVQNDRVKLTTLFRKFTKYSVLVSFPLMLGLAAVSKPLVILLIGPKWIDASKYLQIMCIYAISYPLTIINLNMLNVEGRSDIILKLEIIKKLLFLPIFIVGFITNIIYMLWAAVVYYYIEFFLNSYYSEKLFNYGAKKQLKDVLPILVISFLISFAMWLISFISLPIIFILLIQISFGLILYIITFEKLKLKEYIEIKSLLKDKLYSILLKRKYD